MRKAEKALRSAIGAIFGTGEVRLRWLGVGSISGVILGTRMVVEGMLGEEDGERLMIDPAYELLFTPERPYPLLYPIRM